MEQAKQNQWYKQAPGLYTYKDGNNRQHACRLRKETFYYYIDDYILNNNEYVLEHTYNFDNLEHAIKFLRKKEK